MIYHNKETVPPKNRLYYTEVHETNDAINIEKLFEAAALASIKQNIIDVNELKAQWKKVANKFAKHVWIYRYIDDKQKEALSKHYAVLTDDNCYYSSYKKSFKAICKFVGLPADSVILENVLFTKSKKDDAMYEISVKYSRGSAKVQIPEGIELIHASPVEGIKELIPSFRSKVKGKYMYPTKRVFFTVTKQIKKTQAGLEGKKLYQYTPKTNITEAYIDPTYADFKQGSVYIETETAIPVQTLQKKLLGLFPIKDNSKEGES